MCSHKEPWKSLDLFLSHETIDKFSSGLNNFVYSFLSLKTLSRILPPVYILLYLLTELGFILILEGSRNIPISYNMTFNPVSLKGSQENESKIFLIILFYLLPILLIMFKIIPGFVSLYLVSPGFSQTDTANI